MKKTISSRQPPWWNLGVANQFGKGIGALLASPRRTHGSSLNDETPNTLLIEVEALVNSRSLNAETLADGISHSVNPALFIGGFAICEKL